MTPDEVRMLDNQYALIFIRGERPVLDYKYDLFTHPNVYLSADGGAKPYTHTIEPLAGAAGIEIVKIEDFPGKKMEDFPMAEEYFAGVYAYDEEETEAMCEYLSEKQKGEVQK